MSANQATLDPNRNPAEFRIGSIIVPLLAIIAGVFMVILDATAMNVALSSLVHDFDAPLSRLQWTVTGYMLAQASVIPLSGWLSDRFGAKRVFLVSVVLFTVGSALCALPNSAEWLILFRVIQGLGGGCVLPVAMAYVYRLSPPEKVGVVMGMMGVPILFAPAIGPVLSGWLVEFHSWRWIFLINIPIGLICLWVGLRRLPKIDKQRVATIDVPGIILGPLAFAALSYGVSEGAHGWSSAKTLTGLIVGGIALILFIFVELRSKTPLLELRVFRSLDFSAGIIVQWIAQFALYGALFLMPQFLQQARGFEPFDTGLTLLPQALASGLMMPIAGMLFDKIGVRWLVVAGLGLVSGALYQYSHVDLTTQRVDLILPLLMCGAGMGMMMMPMNSHLISKAPRDLVSRVTSLTNAMQQVISSLAVATLVTILTSRTATKLTELQSAAGGAGAAAGGGASSAGSAGAGAAAGAAKGTAATPEAQAAFMEAMVHGFRETFHVMIFIAIAGALLGLVLRRGKKPGAQEARDGKGKGEEAVLMHG
ncbi:DHA2 family efflux MFS transporter permease subunit [Paenibacillus koleovorans]|uniref:DHA2 family efflux MFS transporter permease subunit n=1 Tax=Paenibacillus koleovorans TaxID=121608 RepID=UPI000FDB4CE5|nr:DHA2 family efflux MFS transporter permease subunit [Paenibacillus koleovorans]